MTPVPANDDGRVPPCPGERGSGPIRNQKTVLVIDDERDMLNLIRDILRFQYQVVCVNNTQEADAVLRARPVHAILCDHMMPGENGLSFLLRIRQSHPLIPRLLITGYARPDMMLDAINQSGVFRYIVKPFRVEELQNAVDDALRTYESADRHARLGKENADLRSSLSKLMSRSASFRESPSKILAFSAVGLLGVLFGALLLGLLVFVLLYALKSALGIDFFPNWSHSGMH